MKKILVCLSVLLVGLFFLSSCEKEKYLFSFHTNGGEKIESTHYSLEDLPKASKEGHSFVGWYLDSELNTSIDNTSYTIFGRKNIIDLYAKFEVNKYTININQNDSITSLEYEFNEHIEINLGLESPYDLYFDKELTNSFNLVHMPAHDLDLYVKEMPNTYLFVFETNSGNKVEPIIMKGFDLELLPKAEKEGFIFEGWYIDQELTEKVTSAFKPERCINILYAKYLIDKSKLYKVKVTSNINGALEVSDNSLLEQEVNQYKPYSYFDIKPSLGYKLLGFELAYGDTSITINGDRLILPEITSDITVTAIYDYETLELPIVSVSTEDAITSKFEYTDMSFSLFNTEGELESASGGIRLRGNTTMGYAKKPYRIKFDKKQSLFGLAKAKSWVLLANYLDPSSVKNFTALTLANELDGMRFNATPNQVNLFLNGEYLGIYTLCEQIQENEGRLDIEQVITEDMSLLSEYNFFISMDYSTHGEFGQILDETYFYISKYDRYFELKYPEKEDFTSELQFRSFFNQLKDYTLEIMDLMNEGSFEEIKEKVNINSLVDYYIVDSLLTELDHGGKSFNMFHTVSSTNKEEVGKLSFGPCWDYDFSAVDYWTGLPSEVYELPQRIHFTNIYFKAINRVDEIKEIFKERLSNSTRKMTNVISKVESTINSMTKSLELNNTKWYSSYNYNITNKNIEFIIKYFKERMVFLKDYWLN